MLKLHCGFFIVAASNVLATHIAPGLLQASGRREEFYGGLVIKADTQMQVTRVLAEGKLCTVELEARSPQEPDKAQYAIDLFQVNAQGLIEDVSIYYRNFNLR